MSDAPISERSEDVHRALLLVKAELLEALNSYPPMATPHEGAAIIREEWDELWDIVKVSKYARVGYQPELIRKDLTLMRSEAIQIAAMAVRFVIDVCKVAR